MNRGDCAYAHGVLTRSQFHNQHSKPTSTTICEGIARGRGGKFQSKVSVCPAVVGLVLDLKGQQRLDAHHH